VLPFAALQADDTADDTLALGLADAVITRLSAIDRLVVRPTSAILRYRKGPVDPQAAGRDLAVDYVLDSRLQRHDGKLRITFQLVAVADGSTRWTDRMEAAEAGLFEAQDTIAERVAASMLQKLSRHDRRLLRKRDTDNPQSHLAYLRGRHFWAKRTEAGLAASIAEFQRAVAFDPANAAAHAGLADVYNLLAAYGSADPQQAFIQAKSAALQALALNPDLAEAHASLGFARAHHDRDWPGAEKEYRAAIALAPQYATARQWLALAHAAQGHANQAIEEARRALASDPLSLIINTDLGRHYYYARRYDEAIAQLRATIDLDPSFPRAHVELGRAYKQKGMHDLAVAELTRAVQLSERGTTALAELAGAYAGQGDRARARTLLDELEQRARNTHVSPYHFAVVWSALGDPRRAMATLDAADAERFNWTVFANVEPEFDVLRDAPAFSALVARLRVAAGG
jgi:TolB-like protein/Tfp pilus assembly protein PilF